jgi:mRNA interferase MazF
MIKGEIWWANLPASLASAPANILLEKAVSGLAKTSVINFSQIVTIDKSRLIELVFMLPKSLLAEVHRSLQHIFDIPSERPL